MSDGTIQKVVGVAMAIFVAAVILPPAFDTLANSGVGRDNTESIYDNTLIDKDTDLEKVGDNIQFFIQGYPSDIEDKENIGYIAVLHPTDLVDNYSVHLYEHVVYENGDTKNIFENQFNNKSDNLDLYDIVPLSDLTSLVVFENVENINGFMEIEEVFEGGVDVSSGLTADNFGDYFEVSYVKYISEDLVGERNTIGVLLIVLLPILSIVGIIRIIYGNI